MRKLHLVHRMSRKSIPIPRYPYSKTQVSLFQNPCILAAAALRRIHHQRALLERDARQPTGNNIHLVAKENVRTQIYMPRLQLIAEEAGRAREIQRRLCNVVAWIGLDRP